MTRALLVLVVVTFLVQVSGAAAARDDPPDIGVHAGSGHDSFDVDALLEGSGSAHTTSSASDDATPTEYTRAPACRLAGGRIDLPMICDGDDGVDVPCLDGTVAVDPLWMRTQDADGTWSEWRLISWYECPDDSALIAAILHEWTQLKPLPSDIALEPNTGWVLATVPTVAMANDAPRLHATTLLGAAVQIRATASGYRWNWGDGSQTTTTDPGRPYPNATVTHTYPHAADATTVTLTTTWTGEYRVNGGSWVAFDTTIDSTSAPVGIAIYDPRSRLVDCAVGGSCRIEAGG